MDSFIKKIFEKNIDEMVHLQFQKFSKGEFKNKALVKGVRTGKGFSITTSYEYANELVKGVAEKLGEDEKVQVTGAIVSTRDLSGEIEFKDKKQFQGVKRYILDTEMSKEEIINLCDNFPHSFLAISFSAGDTQLKIKAKAPKSSKAKNKTNERPKPDFCRLKTKDWGLVKGLLFDVSNFKRVEISHDFVITGLDIPKNEPNPAKMRENTIRKGKIIRRINIDGSEMIEEIEFEA